MAELTPKYMDIDGVYSGDELGLPWRDVIGEGIVEAGDLAVTQDTPASLSVDVAAGSAWIVGDTAPTSQPTYRVTNDAVVNLGITPDASNPRKVIIVAQINDETFAGTGRNWELLAIHGTPDPAPVEPALPASAIKLAVVDVAAAATSIVTADITDSRTLATVGGGSLGGGGGSAVIPIDLRNPGAGANAGNCFPNVLAHTNWDKWHWEFVKDVVGVLYGIVRVPSGSYTAPKVLLDIAANAVTGVTRMQVNVAKISDGATYNFGAWGASQAQDITVPGTAYLRKQVEYDLSAVGALAEGDELAVLLYHDGVHANDTLAVNTLVTGAWLKPS